MTTGNLKLAFILEAVDRATATVKRVQGSIGKLPEQARRVRTAFQALGRDERVRSALDNVVASGRRFSSWARSAVVPLAGIAAVSVAASFGVMRLADSINEAVDLAPRLGLTYEQLQRLGVAATLNASSQEEAAGALQNLVRRIGEARNGSKEALAWFDRVGVSMQQLRQLSALQVFEAIADRFHLVGDGAGNAERKLQSMMYFFGRSNTGLKQMLDLGGDGLRAFYAEADTLGAVVSTLHGENLATLNNQLDRVRLSLGGLSGTVAGAAAPAITAVVARVEKWVVQNRALVQTRVQQFLERLLDNLPTIVTALGQAASGAMKLVAAANAVAEAIGGWGVLVTVMAGIFIGKGVLSILAFAKALGLLNLAMWANPIGVMIIAVGLLAAGAATLIAKWEPVKKFFVDLIQRVVDFHARVANLAKRFLGFGGSVPAMPEPGAAAGAPVATGGVTRRAEVGGTIRIEMDNQGRWQVRSARPVPGSLVDFDVHSGLSMVGQ